MSMFDEARKAKSGGNFTIAPAGTHIARCYEIVDLGTQTTNSTQYGEKQQRKLRVSWELPNTMVVFDEGKGEQPKAIMQQYTMSFHEKSNLYKDLVSWRGKDFTQEELEAFEHKNIIGKACLISVVHKEVGDKTYANIASISPLMSGQECPKQVNKSLIFDLTDFKQDVYDGLSDYLKGKIADSPEYKAIKGIAPDVVQPAIVAAPKDAEVASKDKVIPAIPYESDVKPEDLPF